MGIGTFALIGAALFYLIYLIKGLLLRKQGINVNLLGDKDHSREKYFEIILKVLTGIGGILQIATPFLFDINKTGWAYVGVVLIYFGVLLFLIAVRAMGLNWRAGYNEKQKTELVTSGIYRFSRNPAFVAFDLLYLGFAVLFPNILMLFMAVIAVVLFDQQIRGEEKFLLMTFDDMLLRNIQTFEQTRLKNIFKLNDI
ncbi:isoprenylcysteine carboxylmethyltransferase family protein [Enterococcus hulanensis]|uniref:Isoprenylcysteine carboxylmethyltransferase family protein n=1 Tax=Enterococcus hulanensis TaxID=2559929 RepID=A0ABU3EUN5_9ENTE|nr:isoprenylcysteine carboxylmethyltransferase family protein [Enterococcus hulanensis]MDT2598585.1 isoprenylcysteine carboxylmethyltransferase family protein [Enterococcus hulanensis]MDT2607910.1 isoprenylcysteine carboxylmethyltransferase family protein [Enterococcus hulanensis]MDT2615205.1 isoprenylcysteine carboxylmethyltransferase family protein [Enterococcus hulanensis]MDT2626824.1 isoprenylcysteine carboxylmethyltransferase family protein [Enterococcus hulanensis]MDT2654277.1 isoprenylc